MSDNLAHENQGGSAGENKSNTSAAEEKQEARYTNADVDRIIAKKFAAWEKKKEREIAKAQMLAEIKACERAEHERDELQKKLDELRDKYIRLQMHSEARRKLAAENISISDDLLNLMVSKDADTTQKAVEAFKVMYKTDISKAVNEALRGSVLKG